MKIKLLSAAYHRNGISGEPFITGLFKGEAGNTMLFVDFGESRFAVLQVELLAEGDVEFGSNSWRGDNYAEEIRNLYPAPLKGAWCAND